MDRCALFVDAGYALTDGAMAVHGTPRRDSVSWDHAGLLKLLAGLARDRTGLPVLRCYWYETAEGRRTAEHDALAEMPGLKLRLVNTGPGRREGVESQMRRDLVTLAKSGAISDAFIASADDNMAELVSEVQDLGLRVVVLHIASENGWTIPQPLRQECDDIVEISGVHLRPFVELIRGAEPSLPQEQPYRAASGVTKSDEALAGTPANGAVSHTGLPAQALPASAGGHQPADSGSAYAQAGQPYEETAGQSAAAAYQATAVARDAGVPQGSNGAGHRASHAAGTQPGIQYGNGPGDQAQGGHGQQNGSMQPNVSVPYGYGGSDRGHAGDGPANGSLEYGQGDQRHARAAASNGSVQAGQPGGPGAGQARNSGQFPVLPDGQAQPGAGQARNSGQFPVLPDGQPQPGAGQARNSGQFPVLPEGTDQHAAAQPGTRGQSAAAPSAAPPGGLHSGASGNGHGQYGSVQEPGAYIGPAGSTNGGTANGGAANGGTANGGTGDFGRPTQSPYQTGPQHVFDAPRGEAVRNGAAHDGSSRHGGASVFDPYQGGHSANGVHGELGAGSALNGGGAIGYTGNGAGSPGHAQNNGAAYPGAVSRGETNGYAANGPGAHGQYGQSQSNGVAYNGVAYNGVAHPDAVDRRSNGYASGQPVARQPVAEQPGPAELPMARQAPPPGQQHHYPGGVPAPGPNGMPHPAYPGAHAGTGREQAGLPMPARATTPAYPPYPSQQYQAQQYQQQSQQGPALPAVRQAQPVAVSLADAVKAAHSEGFSFGESVSREAPGLWLEAVLARKPRMPSDLEARLLQGSVLPIDSLLHDEVRHSLRRGFWEAMESARR